MESPGLVVHLWAPGKASVPGYPLVGSGLSLPASMILYQSVLQPFVLFKTHSLGSCPLTVRNGFRLGSSLFFSVKSLL